MAYDFVFFKAFYNLKIPARYANDYTKVFSLIPLNCDEFAEL